MDLNLHIDGGSRGNPGPAAAGVVVTDAATGKPVHEAGYCLGKATNNVAEYRGLILGLKIAQRLKPDAVHIFSDSQLMVKQVLGEYKMKSPLLAPLLEEVQRLLLGFDHWQIRHVLRDKNKRADALVNDALDRGRHVIATAAPNTDDIAPTWTGQPTQTNPNASPQTRNPKPETRNPKPGPCWLARFRKRPGPRCPARPRANNEQFELGPATPAGLCIYAAQAVFDEHITLWPDAKRTEGQTECPRCGVVIEIERRD